MSLTKQDLTDIRSVILEALDVAVNPRLDHIEAQLDEHSATLAEHGKILNEHGRRLTSIEERLDTIEGRLLALEADIKELHTLADTNVPLDKKFASLPPEQKVRKLHSAVLTVAKQLHVEL